MAKQRPASAPPLRTKPPMRHGVSPSLMVLPNTPLVHSPAAHALLHQPAYLLDYLEHSAHIPPGQTWRDRLSSGQVFDDAGLALGVDTLYAPTLRIYYYRHIVDEPRVPFDETIIYEDEHLLVADKPHFLPVSPTGRYVQETLLVRLKNRTGLDDLTPIHRLDRDTAGVVLFSKQIASRNAYAAMFRARQAHKVYEAIAPYRANLIFPVTRQSRLVTAAASFMQMQEALGAPNSTTHISLLEARGDWARYQLQPVTGQRHQLRVHMLALGLPLRFDAIYPVLTPEPALGALDYSQPLQLLAQSIAFNDPVTGQARQFRSAHCLHLP